MQLFNSNDLAIRTASLKGTLKLVPFVTRFGDNWVSIQDDVGAIEVVPSIFEANKLVKAALAA